MGSNTGKIVRLSLLRSGWVLLDLLVTISLEKYISMQGGPVGSITALNLAYFGGNIVISKFFERINKTINFKLVYGMVTILIGMLLFYLLTFEQTYYVWLPYAIVAGLALSEIVFKPWYYLKLSILPKDEIRKALTVRTITTGLMSFICIFVASLFLTGYIEIKYVFYFAIGLGILIPPLIALEERLFKVKNAMDKDNANALVDNENKRGKIELEKLEKVFKGLLLSNFVFLFLIKSVNGVTLYLVLEVLGKEKEFQFKFVAMYYLGSVIGSYLLKPILKKGTESIWLAFSFLTIACFYLAIFITEWEGLWLLSFVTGAASSFVSMRVSHYLQENFKEQALVKWTNIQYQVISGSQLLSLVLVNLFLTWGKTVWTVYIPLLIGIGFIYFAKLIFSDRKAKSELITPNF
ncbi:hypothetical protein ABEW34_21540 [Paenibacillus algorifonticola]|uniref:hypothetical protein n=1 Tax=Paenibacillus algorifonticola TaxID=684063 RepID=UPI003D2ACEDC